MPEIDSSYQFVAMSAEERSSIVRNEVARLERAYFEAQLQWSLRKSEIDLNSEAGKSDLDVFKNQMKVHKARLTAARKVLDEVAPTPPAPVAEPVREVEASVDDPANVSKPEAAKSTKAGKKK